MNHQVDSLPEFENHAEQETKFTTCYMCACRCGIKVTTEGNEVRFIQGNPNHPINKGVLCAKGNSGIMKQSSPAKLSKQTWYRTWCWRVRRNNLGRGA